MSKVFVTQQNLVRTEEGGWRPRFDLSPAAEHGELVYIFGPGQIGLQPESVIDAIEQRLEELNYNPDEDFLLATGDMVLGAFAFHQMMMRGGCRMLRWDNRYRRYNVIKGETYDGDD
jgi:hypothetical protein